MNCYLTKKISIFYFLLLSCFANSIVFAQSLSDSPTRIWLKQNLQFSLSKTLDNILTSGDERGAIIAAQSRYNPNYYYHWVRDAALTINSLIEAYPSLNRSQRELVSKNVYNYLDFSTRIQNAYTLSGLGEPKFNVDGTAFNDSWARPQNDSPALRAISLIHWAQLLIKSGNDAIVEERMYNSQLPATSPIKKDLEYISHHWSDPSYDLWEEVKGIHFYSLMVERRALIEGAALAKYFKDYGAADWYLKQARLIESKLQQFWDSSNGYIGESIDRVGGIDYKYSNLDIGVILGLLHGDLNDNFFRWDDPRVQATIEKLINEFSNLYPINHDSSIPGIAIGRYPEDRYSGANFDGGNPWPLCTLAIAEALYRYAKLLSDQGKINLATKVADRADQFVERVRYHSHGDGSLNEQIDRNTGYMTSANDLTWNYAALLSTRESALKI